MIDAALSIDYVVKDPPPIVYFNEFWRLCASIIHEILG